MPETSSADVDVQQVQEVFMSLVVEEQGAKVEWSPRDVSAELETTCGSPGCDTSLETSTGSVLPDEKPSLLTYPTTFTLSM